MLKVKSEGGVIKLRKSDKQGYYELVSNEGIECYLTPEQVNNNFSQDDAERILRASNYSKLSEGGGSVKKPKAKNKKPKVKNYEQAVNKPSLIQKLEGILAISKYLKLDDKALEGMVRILIDS